MNLMVAVGPGIAPLIGGAARHHRLALDLLRAGAARPRQPGLGWRLLPESSGGHRPRHARVLRNYRQLLVSRRFLGFAIGGGCATTSMYAFIGASPFIFVHQLHRPVHEVGIYLALTSSASGSAAWRRAG